MRENIQFPPPNIVTNRSEREILLKKIAHLWETCTDLRFFQLIELIRVAKTRNFVDRDMFFLENSEVSQKIDEIYRDLVPNGGKRAYR